MRYLVTGGAGFLGSHVVDRLLANGAHVAVLDDLSTGRRANLAAAAGQRGFELHVGCVSDRARVASLVGGVDFVIHLAAVVGVRLVHDAPLRAMRRNVEGTDAVFAAATSAGVPVLYASSSEVYGCGGPMPLREDADVRLGPVDRLRGGYACAKALGEWSALAWAREHGLRAIVARLFNTIGPRQRSRHGMVVPRLVSQALRGRPLTIYGDGTQTRAFADVGDVVSALLGLIAGGRAWGEVVNVGSSREVSINELAARIVVASGSASCVQHVPFDAVYPSGGVDIRRRVPCVAKLRALTGMSLDTPLDTTLAAVVAERRVDVAAR